MCSFHIIYLLIACDIQVFQVFYLNHEMLYDVYVRTKPSSARAQKNGGLLSYDHVLTAMTYTSFFFPRLFCGALVYISIMVIHFLRLPHSLVTRLRPLGNTASLSCITLASLYFVCYNCLDTKGEIYYVYYVARQTAHSYYSY